MSKKKSSTPSLSSQISALQGKISGETGMSADEQAAQDSLNTISNSAALGVSQLKNQQIPVGFITGQQSAVTDRASEMSLPLKTRLAALQAQRQSALDADTSSLGFLKDKYDTDAAKKAAKASQKSAQKIAKIQAGSRVQVADINATKKAAPKAKAKLKVKTPTKKKRTL